MEIGNDKRNEIPIPTNQALIFFNPNILIILHRAISHRKTLILATIISLFRPKTTEIKYAFSIG